MLPKAFALVVCLPSEKIKIAILATVLAVTVMAASSCGSAYSAIRSAPSSPPSASSADALTVSISTSPKHGLAPLLVELQAAAVSSTGSPLSSWTWSYGDGMSCDGASKDCGMQVSHSYTGERSYTVSVAVTDAAGTSSYAMSVVTVSNGTSLDDVDQDNLYCGIGNIPMGSITDGPASMPVKCMNSSLAATPSPGQFIALAADADIQAAYGALQCGQTLLLAHGATWNGPFQFMPKGCDDQHWITIESDGSLPMAGSRISPGDLPQMAAISMKPGSAANLVTGDHIRFVGIAWLKEAGGPLVDFVEVPGAVKVIFDRNYAHGNSGEESRRFISLSDGSYVAVVESFIDEMHCLAPGTCLDSQAISGGGDSFASGPFKIVNNYLSAAGENIIFGGGKATNTPCDIEIRRNYMYKPISWNPDDPTYTGTKYVVKNLFELKNACRVLFEGNSLANNWGGFTQTGIALLIGPKNEAASGGANLCPVCFVSDVVMRYSRISTAAGAFAIFNVRTPNLGGWAAGGHNYSLHDLVFENLEYATCYYCSSDTSQISSGYETTDPPPSSDVLHDVLLNHVTIVTVPTWPVPGSKRETAALELDGPPMANVSSTPQISNVVYENSVFGGGSNGFYPTGGGQNNCSVGQTTLPGMLSACWTGNSLFGGNLVVGYTGKSAWPSANLASPSWENVNFVNYRNGDGGDYQLSPGSPFVGRALDGSDPGADIKLVREYTNEVEQH